MENINIIWNVHNITVWPQLGTLTNVAYLVNYSVKGENPLPYGSRTRYDSVVLPQPDAENFVPYDQLTETQVLNWVKSVLGAEQVSYIESELWHGAMLMRSLVSAHELVTGQRYQIELVGNTDWTQVGAVTNDFGITFIATGPGTGTGKALGSLPLSQPVLPWAS